MCRPSKLLCAPRQARSVLLFPDLCDLPTGLPSKQPQCQREALAGEMSRSGISGAAHGVPAHIAAEALLFHGIIPLPIRGASTSFDGWLIVPAPVRPEGVPVDAEAAHFGAQGVGVDTQQAGGANAGAPCRPASTRPPPAQWAGARRSDTDARAGRNHPPAPLPRHANRNPRSPPAAGHWT